MIRTKVPPELVQRQKFAACLATALTKADRKVCPLKILGNFVLNFREWIRNSKNYKPKGYESHQRNREPQATDS